MAKPRRLVRQGHGYTSLAGPTIPAHRPVQLIVNLSGSAPSDVRAKIRREAGGRNEDDVIAHQCYDPTVKLIADAKGRLTAAELFKRGKAFDANPMPDGSIRIFELTQ